MLASDVSVTVGGTISAVGLGGGSAVGGGPGGAGSGGAIRIVSPIVAGTGTLRANGLNALGNGRQRIDTLDRTQLNLKFNGVPSSIGRFMKAFPDVAYALHIVKVAYRDAQGNEQSQAIPEGAPGPVVIRLPFGAPPRVRVTIQARGMTGQVPIKLVTTPENGSPADHPVTVDMGAGGVVEIEVEIPVNTRTHLLAFTQ